MGTRTIGKRPSAVLVFLMIQGTPSAVGTASLRISSAGRVHDSTYPDPCFSRAFTMRASTWKIALLSRSG
eukprot:7539327-Pyramimonas_sp.AAC.1